MSTSTAPANPWITPQWNKEQKATTVDDFIWIGSRYG